MPKRATGGTEMYCPTCKKITVCKARPIAEFEGCYPDQRGRLGGVHYFKRYRECLSCEDVFETAEIPETLVTELVGLRALIMDLQNRLNDYTNIYAPPSEGAES